MTMHPHVYQIFYEIIKLKPLTAKFTVFEAVSRAVICYGAQVWGFNQVEQVEKLQRFFLKKLFGLPTFTPNYMLYLETGRKPMFLYTLRLHFKYILKILNLPDHRLPRSIALKCMEKKFYWYKEWLALADKYDLSIGGAVGDNYEEFAGSLVRHVDAAYRRSWLALASRSQHHSLYSKLSYSEGRQTYLSDDNKLYFMRVMFRARCQLLSLKYKPFGNAADELCTLCNLQEREDGYHFLGVCPILREYRLRWFGKARCSEGEVVDLLNGGSWYAVFHFVTRASVYRKFLVDNE